MKIHAAFFGFVFYKVPLQKHCHPRADGDPSTTLQRRRACMACVLLALKWIPAFAGMTQERGVSEVA